MNNTWAMFGNAPSFEQLKKQDDFGIEYVTAPKFWYFFRKYLIVITPLSFLLFLIIPCFTVAGVPNAVLWASVLSLISCFLVLLSNYHVVPWRRYPSPILVQVNVSSFLTSAILIIGASVWSYMDASDTIQLNYSDGSNFDRHGGHSTSCKLVSFLVQFVLFSRYFWIFTLSLDLMVSITNPFASYKQNMRFYHFIVWSSSFVTGVVLSNCNSCQGHFIKDGLCWLVVSKNSWNICFMMFLYMWLLLSYVISLGVVIYAYFKMQRGLDSTYATRYACVNATSKVVIFYIFYNFLLSVYLTLVSYFLHDKDGDTADVLYYIYTYFGSCVGFIDALLWFFLHGFNTDGSSSTSNKIRNHSSLSAQKSISGEDYLKENLLSKRENDLDVEEEVGVEDLDTSRLSDLMKETKPSKKIIDQMVDIDLSPQLNLALRAALLQSVTKGIKESVRRLQQRDFHRTFQQLCAHGSSGVDFSFFENQQGNATEVGSFNSNSGNYVAELRASLETINSQRRESQQTRGGFRSTSWYTEVPDYNSLDWYSRMWVSLKGFFFLGFGSHLPGEYGVDRAADDPLDFLLPNSRVLSVAATERFDTASETCLQLLQSPPVVAAVTAYQDQVHEKSSLERVNSPFSKLFDHSVSKKEFGKVPYEHNKSVYTGKEREKRQSVESSWSSVTGGANQQSIPPAAPAEVVFNLDEKHQFRDFRPATFRKLRQLSGVEEERYLELISQPTKERLSEGASGAFFFICGQGELIVKTVERSEAMALLEVLDKYVGYLSGHRESLLMRILGLHAIKMYSSDFHFVVLKNVFPPEVQLNEKYDIKGSWVNRHAKVRRPGKQSMCRYCNEVFIEGVGTNEQCPAVVGSHEAFMTLKDNDMINKLRLFPDHACNVLTILSRDSDALSDMGLTDYSLLVGVKNRQYDIDEIQNLVDSPSIPGRFLRSHAFHLDGNVNPTEEHLVDERSARGTGESLHGFPARAVIAPTAYYLGVVDILQTWSWTKQLERVFKVYVLGQSGDGVSCMHPEQYKVRFQKKMLQIIEHSICLREVTGSWRGCRSVSKTVSVLRVPNEPEKLSSVIENFS